MRIWDVPASELCRVHLLGEHRELHAIWNIITQYKKGYSSHPETKRWVGKLAALYLRHDDLVAEMGRRGYVHRSDLNPTLATGERVQNEYIDSIERQKLLLAAKPCACYSSDYGLL